MRNFQDGATIQVAMITRNLEAAVKHHWETARIGPWDIYEIGPDKMRNYFYRGKPATHTFSIAVAWSGETQLELIQPLSLRGYSIYDEHLDRFGEGLHHIKLYYADRMKAVAEYAKRGYSVIQCGNDDDEHYYLDTAKDFGYILELGNAGRIRPAERRVPA